MRGQSEPDRNPPRRQAIIDSALECFSASGYTSTTIDDIRLASGASIGSLYHHFDGKEAIAEALYLDRLTAYETSFLGSLEPEIDARPGVMAAVSQHLAWAESRPKDASFLLGHADIEQRLARRGELPEVNARFYVRVGTWVRRQIDCGLVRALPADLFYALWLGPAQELSRQWLSGRTSTSPTAAADLLAQSAWHSLAASEG